MALCLSHCGCRQRERRGEGSVNRQTGGGSVQNGMTSAHHDHVINVCCCTFTFTLAPGTQARRVHNKINSFKDLLVPYGTMLDEHRGADIILRCTKHFFSYAVRTVVFRCLVECFVHVACLLLRACVFLSWCSSVPHTAAAAVDPPRTVKRVHPVHPVQGSVE